MNTPPVLALFQRRIDGDDSLLRLAGLRFAQAGIGAEVYAGGPDELDRLLPFVAPYRHLPMVHLDRALTVLGERDRAAIATFVERFTGRISGVVVHDKADMRSQTDDVVEGMREVASRAVSGPHTPIVFLEYAAGMPLGWFVEVAQRLQPVEGASVCVDIGHIGIREARRCFAMRHDAFDLGALTPEDPRLVDVIDDVQAAVDCARPAVVEVVRALGALGKPVHFHLHDGHPVIRGLADHRSFLMELPVPFSYRGRRSLGPMYGPAGLAHIARAAAESCGRNGVSFTLEIHEREGRLPLDDAAPLFRHWRDQTNAERMNAWLADLAANRLVLGAALDNAE